MDALIIAISNLIAVFVAAWLSARAARAANAAKFSNAKPPIFHNVTNVVQIDFSGTRIGFALPGKRS
jgi:hypothetical protein